MTGNKRKAMLILGFILILFPVISFFASRMGLQRGVEYRERFAKYDALPPMEDFELRDHVGQVVNLASLKDKTIIANFFFTRCAGPCPKVMAEMARLNKEFRKNGADAIVLLSFTVDPEYDTPEVLRHTAWHYGADSSHWHFLSGPKEQMFNIINNNFKIAAVEGDGTPEGITHSTKIVLVRPNFRVGGTKREPIFRHKIAGFYEGLEHNEVNTLMEDAAYVTPRKRNEAIEYKVQ